MMKEHKRLASLFDSFKEILKSTKEDEIKDRYKDILKRFDKFKWNLEKHFFVEEKVIVSGYLSAEKITSNDDVENIMNDHEEMLKLLKDIEEDLNDKKIPDTLELESLLKTHKKNEDESFYPLLDERLSDDLKEIVISRCEEIIPS